MVIAKCMGDVRILRSTSIEKHTKNSTKLKEEKLNRKCEILFKDE